MFKRITPQTIADWGERIYIRFLELTKRFTSTQIMALLAVIVGVLAGLGTCLFDLLLYGIKAGLTHWFPVEQSHFLFLFYPVIGIILASLFVKYVVKDNISEGVTRVLYAMSRKNSYIAPHNCWTSVVGGATTIGFGGSVGPEAPIVLTGAAIGSNVSRLAHLNYKNTTLLLCCGAGAALAAIFKAPITGVVFVLEILMLDLTSRTVVPLLISSITAAAIALTIRGFDPIIAISLTPDDAFRLNQIPLFVLLGIFCGLMSYYFTTVNARVIRSNCTTRNTIDLICRVSNFTILLNSKSNLSVFHHFLAIKLFLKSRSCNLSSQTRSFTCMREVHTVNRVFVFV